MSKIFNLFLVKFFFIILILFNTNLNNAKEILIYADTISYDENENIIAKGNAKVFEDNQLIISELIIYDKLEK